MDTSRFHGIYPILAAASVIVASLAAAQPAPAPSRGELLYATHCIACHTTQVHWRQKKLATDWASLNAQVRRWAANTGLGWSDEEVVDVARYLNTTQYRFATPSGTELGQGRLPPAIARVE
jgi:mono/diheme cytochrome c family protein